MHFKDKIWDFLNRTPEGLPSEAKVIAFKCEDPYLFQLIKNRFKENFFNKNPLKICVAEEVKLSWFEDQFLSYGLFGNLESFLILGAQNLEDQITELLLSPENLITEGRRLILVYEKDHKGFKKLAKSESELVSTVQVLPAAFWEDKKLLDFLCLQMKLNLNFELKNQIIHNTTFGSHSYIHSLEVIKLNFERVENLNWAEVFPLIGKTKLDHFKIVENLASKKMSLFYHQIIEAVENKQDIIQLLYLLQSHFLKMYDPSYLDKKPRKTKYDQDILNQASLWSQKDMVKVISYINELLILSKGKSSWLLSRLRSDQLKLLKF